MCMFIKPQNPCAVSLYVFDLSTEMLSLGKVFFCPFFQAGVCAIVHTISSGVSFLGAHIQLPGAVGELQQRHLFAEPM